MSKFVPDSSQRNTKSWVEGYLHVTKNPLLHSIRNYYQEKAFSDFVKDKNMKILDVGCGSGDFLTSLKESGYDKVYGVEPNGELLKQLNNDNIKRGISTDLPFEGESFNCIYFFNVLHHLRNTDEYHQTIKETDRCLKPGGLIILIEPCNEYIYSTKRFIAKILSPVSRLFANIYCMMMEEKETVTYFFENHEIIRENLLKMNYKILRDTKLFHQWTLVARK